MNGFDTLAREAKDQGLFRRNPSHVLLCLAGNAVLAGLAVWAFGASTAWWGRISSALVLAAATVGFGTHSHTSLHFGTSSRKWVNVLLGRVGFPLLAGLSACWWVVKHNQLHHQAPNVPGVDEDADLAPWFILTEEEYLASKGTARLWYRWQWVFFPLALFFNYANFFHQSWRFVLAEWRNPLTSRTWLYLDASSLLGHLALWLALPATWMGWPAALALFLGRTAALGVLMFVVFGPAHFPMEAAALAEAPPKDGFARHQVAASVDFTTGWLGKLICGGLEYQIEHHLYPAAPPASLPALRLLVREHCAGHGIPFHIWTWDQALWRAFRSLRFRKPVVPGLSALPILRT